MLLREQFVFCNPSKISLTQTQNMCVCVCNPCRRNGPYCEMIIDLKDLDINVMVPGDIMEKVARYLGKSVNR